jgi:hypothetical protein
MFKDYRMKKLTGHKKFYHDDTMDFTFYMKMTEFFDLSVIAFDNRTQNIRQFMVDYASLKAMYDFVDGKPIRPVNKLIDKQPFPSVVRNYMEKDQMLLIRSANSKIASNAVVVQKHTFGVGKEDSISFKRVAWTMPNRSVIGIDTLALPLKGVKAFLEKVQKLFKGVDLEYELNEEEPNDGTN